MYISWNEFKQGIRGKSCLYRGQKDHSWFIKSTLERWEEEFSLKIPWPEYWKACYVAHSRLPENKRISEIDFFEWNNVVVNHIGKKEIEAFKIIIHMRHNGFPSPLLDWTRNPMIAAYFAAKHETCESDFTIFSFKKDNGFGWVGGDVTIYEAGDPRLNITHRHVKQEATYTICVKGGDKDFPESYEKGFEVNRIVEELAKERPSFGQDVLESYTFSRLDKDTVLKDIESYDKKVLFEEEDACDKSLEQWGKELREILEEIRAVE